MRKESENAPKWMPKGVQKATKIQKKIDAKNTSKTEGVFLAQKGAPCASKPKKCAKRTIHL